MNNHNEIRSFRGDNWPLSNFYPCVIIHDGLEYRNLESAFQAAKCSILAERVQFGPLEAAEARRLGRSVTLRNDWENIKLFVLVELVRIKFVSNPGLLRYLLDTGDAYLSEDNTWHDNFYGNCTCTRCQNTLGLNYLGHTLMVFREQMRHFFNCTQP